MKPVIGIISRDYVSKTNKEINITYKDIVSSILKSGGIPIGIPSNINIDDYLNICNGFILQGGDDIDSNNLKTLKKLK